MTVTRNIKDGGLAGLTHGEPVNTEAAHGLDSDVP